MSNEGQAMEKKVVGSNPQEQNPQKTKETVVSSAGKKVEGIRDKAGSDSSGNKALALFGITVLALFAGGIFYFNRGEYRPVNSGEIDLGTGSEVTATLTGDSTTGDIATGTTTSVIPGIASNQTKSNHPSHPSETNQETANVVIIDDNISKPDIVLTQSKFNTLIKDIVEAHKKCEITDGELSIITEMISDRRVTSSEEGKIRMMLDNSVRPDECKVTETNIDEMNKKIDEKTSIQTPLKTGQVVEQRGEGDYRVTNPENGTVQADQTESPNPSQNDTKEEQKRAEEDAQDAFENGIPTSRKPESNNSNDTKDTSATNRDRRPSDMGSSRESGESSRIPTSNDNRVPNDREPRGATRGLRSHQGMGGSREANSQPSTNTTPDQQDANNSSNPADGEDMRPPTRPPRN